MARSLSIAAYLTQLGSTDHIDGPIPQPPRPAGTIIWARCCDPDQLTAIETLERKLMLEDEAIHIVTTLYDWLPDHATRALPEPRGKDAIRAFLDHWQPAMCVWVKGNLDALLLAEMRRVNLHSILVDATDEGLDTVTGRWVPGAMRSVLSQFEAIVTLDHIAAEKLARAGAPPEIILIAGAMEDRKSVV